MTKKINSVYWYDDSRFKILNKDFTIPNDVLGDYNTEKNILLLMRMKGLKNLGVKVTSRKLKIVVRHPSVNGGDVKDELLDATYKSRHTFISMMLWFERWCQKVESGNY